MCIFVHPKMLSTYVQISIICDYLAIIAPACVTPCEGNLLLGI